MKRAFSTWLAFVLLTSIRAAAAESVVSVQVPGADKVQMAVPPGWKHTIDKPPAGIPPTVDLTAPGGTHLKITFMADPKGQFTKPDELEKLVTKANQRYVANSVEKRVTLQRLASNSGPGVYAVFTDPKLASVAKPPAGEFRYDSSGARSLGRQLVIFSLLSNNKDNDEYRQALDLVANGVAVFAGGNRPLP